MCDSLLERYRQIVDIFTKKTTLQILPLSGGKPPKPLKVKMSRNYFVLGIASPKWPNLMYDSLLEACGQVV